MSSGYREIGPLSPSSWRSPVATASLLPTTGNSIGDVTVTQDSGDLYEWNGTSWQLVGGGGSSGITALTGDVSAAGTGSVAATVNSVGGVSAANVASGATAANSATSADTANTIVKRDGSGNFSAGTITASLSGNATTATTATNFSGSLSGDVTGTQSATIVSKIQGTTVSGTTGTGNVVFSSSPTLTGALSAGSAVFSSTISASNLSGTNSGDVTIGTANGLSLTSQVLSLGLASGSTTGALDSTDWNTFNSKQGALTPGSISTSTSGVTVGSGAASTVGPNVTINIQTANSSQPGLLAAADWTTFNNKGSVSSVAVTVPSYLTVSGSPITGSGTIAITGTSESANLFLASPNGSAGAMTPRAIVAADLPSLSGTYVTQSEVGAANGVASLDGSGKVPVGQLPSVVMEYEGAWNPSTNTPALSDGTGSNGNVYYVTAAFAGPVSGNTDPSMVNFQIGDLVIYSATVGKWQLVTPAAGVQSVNGAQGAVTVNAINQLTGQVTAGPASGSASAVATIATNTVTNSNLAQMPADTIKGNNTGSAANAADLTGAQVISILPTFTGDTGSGGTAGIIPAPPAGSAAAGEFLSANGTYVYVDQSKTIEPTFQLIDQAPVPSGSPGTIKYESTTIYTSIANGKNYAIGVGFIGSPTLTIWDISDQTNPILTGTFVAAGGGAYNCTVGVVGGVQYAFVGYNSGSHFVVVNLTNPAAPFQVSNTVITGSAGSIYDVSFLNGYVYCGTQSAGLVVMDVGGGTGSPTTPIQTYTQGSPFKTFGVVAVGTNVYTTYYSTSSPFTVRQIISWTLSGAGTPAVPSLLQSLQVTAAGEALGLSVSGNTAFVTTAATGAYNINLVDVTTPSSMTNLSTINSTNAFGSAFFAVRSGNVLYIPSGNNATYGGAIAAYDITNRSSPVFIAQATTGDPNSGFGGIALSGGFIFAADYGVAASNNGYFDVFTTVNQNFIAGAITTSTEIIQNTLQVNGTTTLASSLNGVLQATAGVVSTAPVNLTSQVTGILPIANGGTNASTAAAAYNNLSPMTTTGDMEYEASAGVAARLPIGTTGQILTVAGGIPTWAAPATGGTVTSVSVVSANGFTGTVANATSTPAITLTGTLSGDVTGTLTATTLTATTNSTLTTLSALSLPYSQLSGTVPTWNQNTTGTAVNITATSNSTLTTLSALSLPYSQVTGGPTPLVFADSLVNTSGTVTLVNDSASPGATKYYGTNGSSVLGYYSIPATGVTSVALADTSTTPIYTVSGSPVTSSGTLDLTLNTQTAHTVFAGPTTGSAAQPTFRALVASDIPALPYVASNTGDIAPSSFPLANNQTSPANVTGLAFANGSVRAATVFYVINVAATTSLYEAGTLQLVQKGATWEMSQTDVGDNSQVVFTVTTAGQIQYTTPNYTGFSSAFVNFRAQAL